MQNLIGAEKVEPRRRFIRSDGALYVVLLVLVIGIIVAGNALSARWDVPRLYIQLALYAILLAIGYAVYRCCLVSFQYTLTDRMLGIERVVGKKRRFEECVHVSDIVSIRPYAEKNADTGALRAMYVGKRQDALCVTVVSAGKRFSMLLSPSEDFAGKLKAQWKIARK